MSESYLIRPVQMSELPAFVQVDRLAFGSNWPAEDMLALDRQVFDADRSLAAFDGDLPVGTATSYAFGLTVPGGAVDAAGVSLVAVLPSHRRRGILSTLMRRQLADVAAKGEPVAVLFASESAIYGRFGYGVAAHHLWLTVRRGEGRPGPAVAELARSGLAPRLRMAEPKQAVASLRQVYDAVQPGRPGMITRSDAWWSIALADPEFRRQGSSPLQCVIAEDASRARGYALYSVEPRWDADPIPIPEGKLHVHELVGADPAATAALWADLLSRDLIGEVKVAHRPADDPLLHLLAEPRRARATISDGLWVRLVDLPAALRRRRYACPVDLVIDVCDDLLPANAGRWRLRAGGLADQAEPCCEPSSAEPDITLGISALGSAYLGGTRLGGLAGAGLVAEHRAGAVAALSAAMFWDPAPWSPVDF